LHNAGVTTPPVDRSPAEASTTVLTVGLSVATADPDARVVRGGWLLWAVGAPIGIALMAFAPTEFFPLVTPLWAVLILWPLWRCTRAIWYAMVDAPHQDWNGSYYEFDGYPIRVQVDGEHALWVCAVDVFEAMRIEGRGRDPARVRLDAGRDGLQAVAGGRQLWFSELGLLAWLSRRRAERQIAFARWLDAEVIGPQRKRRQKLGAQEPRPGRSADGRQG
jgi:hypothetical protein